MNSIHALSDDALLESAKHAVKEERRCTEQVLAHLREVNRRRLHSKRGFATLWEYVTQEPETYPHLFMLTQARSPA